MGRCRYFFPVLFFLILPGDDNLSSCGTNKQLIDTKDVHLNVSDDLVLTLPETEPVRLYYTGRRSQDVELCTVSDNVLSCNSDFKDRVSFKAPNLTVSNMQPSDSGMYIIQKIDTAEVFQEVKVLVSNKGGEILVTAYYHQPATLHCNSSCFGSVQWFKYHSITVAECNQTWCRCQEGYEIPPERYLKGDFSLTITAPEYSDINTYYYWCSDGYEYVFNLTIKAANVSVHLKPGDNLTLEVPNPDQVKVMCNQSLFYENADTCSSHNQSWTSKALACIKLTKVTANDSGVYSVMDGETGYEYYNYKVTVEDQATGFKLEPWSFVSGLVVGVIVIVCIVCIVRYVRCKKCSNSSQKSDTQQSIPCCLEMTNRSSTEQGSLMHNET